MFSTPTSRPPMRTYGRRSSGKRPPPRRNMDLNSDTETEEDGSVGHGNDTPVPKGGERVNKRARTSTPSVEPGAGRTTMPLLQTAADGPSTGMQPLASIASARLRAAGTPSRLSAATLSRETTPAGSPSQNESQEGAASFSLGGTRRAPRRMLSKAQSMATSLQAVTAPSPPSTPSPLLRSTQSMPATPGSGKSQKTAPGSSNSHPGSPMGALLAPTPAPGSPTPTGRAKRTYGRNRTFRESEMTLDSVPQQSYAERRKHLEVDNDMDEGELDGASGSLLAELMLARAPEPISDMRSKGESRSFADEISFLLGGLKEAGVALRRTSATDVLCNMLDPDFVAKMDMHGQTEDIFDTLHQAAGGDELMETALLLFLALISRGRGLVALLQGCPDTVAAIVVKHLAIRNGPLDAEYKGKQNRRLREIASKLEDTTRGGDSHSRTTRGLASMVLMRMCRTELWPLVEPVVASQHVARQALTSLTAELRPLSDRLQLYTKGLDLMPKDGSVDMAHVGNSLAALESMANNSHEERENIAAAEGEHVREVLAGTVALSIVALDKDSEPSLQHQAARSTILTLLLLPPLAALSGLRSVLAGALEQPGFIATLRRVLLERQRIVDLANSESADSLGDEGSASMTQETADDVTSYILALLGSIVEAGGARAAEAIASNVGGTCGKRTCALSCRCNGAPFPATIAELYAEYVSRDQPGEDVLCSYVRGYLAFLIARLMALAPVSRAALTPHLPGNGWVAQVAGLLVSIRELRSLTATAHRHIIAAVDVETGDAGPGGGGGLRAQGAEDSEKLDEAIAFLERAANE